MAAKLMAKNCTPCRGGVLPLDREESTKLLSQTPGWLLSDIGTEIQKTFKFHNFREALEFTQKIGDLAEAEYHHPAVSFGWGYCTVILQTKKIKGLHENDFIMAAKINDLAES